MNKIDKALKNLKEYIRTISDFEPYSKGFTPEIFFSRAEDGVLFLNGEDARNYLRCLKEIVEVATHNEQISQKAVENLVQKAILASLDINERREDVAFNKRIDQAISELRESLRKKPITMQVYFPIAGLAKEGLPFEFGNVVLQEFNKDNIQQFQDILDNQKIPVEEKENIQSIVDDISKKSIGKIFGEVSVKAKDYDAAKILAQRDVRLAIDAINFYSDLIPYSSGYIYLFGDAGRVVIPIPSCSSESLSINFTQKVVGPLTPLSINALIKCNEEKGLGLDKVSELLSGKRSGLGERILSSIQWASRATIETRKEEAFLLYAIALESLILIENDKEELTYHLRTRVAHLLGKDILGKKKIVKQVRDLYIIRSKIVHSGKYQVTDADLNLIRFITKSCILCILTDEPFYSMKNQEQLVKWFDEKILSA
ncbi:MAG TPA: hypothetical protein G4N95_07665 [Anaerolineae bacterium]|nr:hypothetical protein [Anaerolineae bacterium]